jgi:hypothetical protein
LEKHIKHFNNEYEGLSAYHAELDTLKGMVKNVLYTKQTLGRVELLPVDIVNEIATMFSGKVGTLDNQVKHIKEKVL